MNNLTQDSIISTLADSGRPMSSPNIAKALGTDHVCKVRSMLMDLVRDETLERTVGGAYQLRDMGVHDTPARSASVRREILQTDTVAIKASARKSARSKKVESDCKIPDSVVVEVMTLEKAERQADEEKARDQRIRDAIAGLKRKAKRAEMNIEPVADFHFKLEVLDGIGQIDPAIVDILGDIIRDLRRLQALAEVG